MNKFFLFLFIFFQFYSFGQDLSIRWLDQNNNLPFDIKNQILEKATDSSQIEIITKILHQNGYLEAFCEFNATTNQIEINNGGLYSWGNLNLGNIRSEVGNKLNYASKQFYGKSVSKDFITNWHEKFLNYYENNGYPFAVVKMDTIKIEDYQISGNWNVNLNKKVTLDSINIISDEPLPLVFISYYSGLKKNMPYSERIIKQAPTRLKEIPFLVSIKAPSVIFTDQKTTVNLFLKKQKASSFNGVAGFLPNENTGEILITGDAKLALQNALGSGEIIKLNWRKLQTNTQDLNAFINYPYLFNSPVGSEFDLRLYRRDTTFAEQNLKLGLQYAIKQGNFFKVFVENYSSNIISTALFEDFTTLPPIVDVRKRNYGIGLSSFKLNYKYNPRSGFAFNVSASGGTREILENINLNPLIYDSLDLKTNQFSFAFDGEYYWPIFKRSTIKFGNQSKWLLNNQLFANELLRIGGLNTLRGFDEESIQTSGYTIFTTEYRILLEENSFFYVFTDVGFWERNLRNSYDSDLPIGFGTGISFQTKAGIFTVNYALGKQRNNPLDLRVAKIHFGFLSLF